MTRIAARRALGEAAAAPGTAAAGGGGGRGGGGERGGEGGGGGSARRRLARPRDRRKHRHPPPHPPAALRHRRGPSGSPRHGAAPRPPARRSPGPAAGAQAFTYKAPCAAGGPAASSLPRRPPLPPSFLMSPLGPPSCGPEQEGSGAGGGVPRASMHAAPPPPPARPTSRHFLFSSGLGGQDPQLAQRWPGGPWWPTRISLVCPMAHPMGICA